MNAITGKSKVEETASKLITELGAQIAKAVPGTEVEMAVDALDISEPLIRAMALAQEKAKAGIGSRISIKADRLVVTLNGFEIVLETDDEEPA
jgi:hypothetical protein